MKKLLCISLLLSTLSTVVKADEYSVLSKQYNQVFADMLVKKILTYHKNWPITLYLKNSKEVDCLFKEYNKSDASIWVLENGHWLQTGYGVMELMDVREIVVNQEPI